MVEALHGLGEAAISQPAALGTGCRLIALRFLARHRVAVDVHRVILYHLATASRPSRQAMRARARREAAFP